jgi:argininosuccinate synthase
MSIQRTVNPRTRPTRRIYQIDFEKGDGVALNGEAMSPATLLTALNDSAASMASAGSIWSRTASSA